MPIYEYQCKACGHSFEAFQKATEDRLTMCPKCHKPDLQKLISAAGFQLKGTGWYATDFRDKGKAKKAEPDPSLPQKTSETTVSSETKNESTSTGTPPSSESTDK